MKIILFSLPGNEILTQKLAKKMHAELGNSVVRQFADGETYVKVDSDVKGKCVVLVCTLNAPNNKFLPLYFLSQTARELGALSVCLVSPYLAYMRQDRRFQPGESVTSAYFGKLISNFVDSLITVDPHLHRRSSLSEIYLIPNRVIHAAEHIAQWIKTHIPRPIIIGPDRESEQWVSEVAKNAGADFTILQKIRHSDRSVEVSMPDVENYRGYTPVLVDDIISTARTMIETIKHLKKFGLKPPVCIGVHAVFAGNSYEDLMSFGVTDIVTSNTIPHKSNKIDLSDILADNIQSIIKYRQS